MSDLGHSGSRCHSRGSRSHGYGREGHSCSKCHEESGHGERDFFGGRRGRGEGKIGWGRNGAVRLDDPPILPRGRDDLDCGMGLSGEMDEIGPRSSAGYRDGLRAGRMARMGGASRMDPYGRQVGMDQFGGLGGIDPSAGLGVGGTGVDMDMGGRGPMMGRNPLMPPQSPGRQLLADDHMLGLRQQALLRQRLGMEQYGSPLMGPRQGLMGGRLNLGLASAGPGPAGPGGNFDMRAMDLPRHRYGPLQNGSLQNRLANYRSPYVEDYEGSEIEAGMAQPMMNGGIGNPFLYDEGQYGYGGMGQLAQMEHMGGVAGMGGGMNPY